MKHLFDLPGGAFCLAAAFLFFLFSSAPAAGAEASGPAETDEIKAADAPRLLYSITNGKRPDQMAWFTGEKGAAESGYLEGPGAALPLAGGVRLFADTLNGRLVLREADGGRVLKVFELPASGEVGLACNPLITGLASAGNGKIYAADDANLAVWKIDLGPNHRGPRLKVESVLKLADSGIRQTGRISSAPGGDLFVSDIPGQRMVRFGADGAKKFEYAGLTNGAAGPGGLFYHPIYYDDPASRDLEAYDEKGRAAEFFGRIYFGRDICYIAPVGFDSKNDLYIFADSDQKGPVAVRVAVTGDKKHFLTALPAPGGNPVFSAAPYWNGPDGSLEWAEYGGGEIRVYRIEL